MIRHRLGLCAQVSYWWSNCWHLNPLKQQGYFCSTICLPICGVFVVAGAGVHQVWCWFTDGWLAVSPVPI